MAAINVQSMKPHLLELRYDIEQHGFDSISLSETWLNLRPGGGGSFWPPPLWFFEDNSKTKGSSVTKLGIAFH